MTTAVTPGAELRGLSSEAVRARIAARAVNTIPSRPSRSLAQILRANLLTRFNAILGSLLVVIGYVGPPQDGLFGVVLVLNAAIGIVQEVRAKRALDGLAILSAPVAHVVRDGSRGDLRAEDVVLDDLLELRLGDQVVADCVVVQEHGLQLDESLLTGEAAAVSKALGDEVLSGSIVVSGSALARVARVGAASLAQRIQLGAKRFTTVYSELQSGTNRILQVVSWILPPAAALLVTSQLLRSHLTWTEALRGSVAGIGAMVPEGLVLLTTIAFALGALRLARRRVLVQALPAIEGLARVDVVCIDKTGTLTVGGMSLHHVVALRGDLAAPLGALAAVETTPNATMRAIAQAYHAPPDWGVVESVPFSSERRWSAAEFEGLGTWVIGAPDVLFEPNADSLLDDALHREEGAGRRLLAVGRSSSPLVRGSLPVGLTPVGLVVLTEQLRPDAASTVRYFAEQGVTLKILSGDQPGTVAAIAQQVGIDVGSGPVDARTLPEDPGALAEIAEHANVFGRVLPDQKRAIVEALRGNGHVIAMTGDGVNDVPALKQANVGIAMGSGTQATRAVGTIVLLDNEFSALPHVLGEGRRVIGNIERVANLFVTKTVYAALLAITVGILAIPYPFYPRQLTVVSSLTIGVPAFFLALATGQPRAEAHFLRRILRFAVPAGTVVALATLGAYAIARNVQNASTAHSKMTAAVAIFVMAIFVLALLAGPFSPWRLGLVLAMAGGGVLAMLIPYSRELFAFSIPSRDQLATIAAVTLPAMIALAILLKDASGRRHRRARGATDSRRRGGQLGPSPLREGPGAS